jgi:hypothetical protein
MGVHVVEDEFRRDVDSVARGDEQVLTPTPLGAVQAEVARMETCGDGGLPRVHEQVCELRVELRLNLAPRILAPPLKPPDGQQPRGVAIGCEVLYPHAGLSAERQWQ